MWVSTWVSMLGETTWNISVVLHSIPDSSRRNAVRTLSSLMRNKYECCFTADPCFVESHEKGIFSGVGYCPRGFCPRWDIGGRYCLGDVVRWDYVLELSTQYEGRREYYGRFVCESVWPLHKSTTRANASP